jgi:hypothetical protein
MHSSVESESPLACIRVEGHNPADAAWQHRIAHRADDGAVSVGQAPHLPHDGRGNVSNSIRVKLKHPSVVDSERESRLCNSFSIAAFAEQRDKAVGRHSSGNWNVR